MINDLRYILGQEHFPSGLLFNLFVDIGRFSGEVAAHFSRLNKADADVLSRKLLSEALAQSFDSAFCSNIDIRAGLSDLG